MTEELHPSRLRILEFLARRDPTEGPPAVREVGEAVGLKSSQTVHHHLLGLEESGYVERGRIPGRKRRPLRLTEKGWDAVSTRPLLGRIAAGRVGGRGARSGQGGGSDGQGPAPAGR